MTLPGTRRSRVLAVVFAVFLLWFFWPDGAAESESLGMVSLGGGEEVELLGVGYQASGAAADGSPIGLLQATAIYQFKNGDNTERAFNQREYLCEEAILRAAPLLQAGVVPGAALVVFQLPVGWGVLSLNFRQIYEFTYQDGVCALVDKRG